MHRSRLVLGAAALAAVIALAGCDPQSTSDGSSSPHPAGTSAAPATSAATIPPIDTVTEKACTDLKKDIKDNADKVAKAEKIGPPAGYTAVSAQWAAGSAIVIAHSIGAKETVSAAADKVQAEMMKLSEATGRSADAKPSRKNLEAAIAELTAACAQA
ncbi:hypothetical protein AB0J74_26730 [Asanoa sp. NPDC049573]|uniref:hypothetical protein n=1 Tax=Asanoa sp. NPDC049573 TaxID=3155396 RepID=UPI00342B413C